jgi:GH25 family lysozyme M1 (1,4-beta-N-acetylmuramidase)
MAKGRRSRRASRRQLVAAAVQLTKGIDVSVHQGTIDWVKVAAWDVSYAYIKATEGARLVDKKFAANWKGAGGNGIIRGAYHFFNPTKSVGEQLSNFTKTVSLEAGDLAPALDLETDGQAWSTLPPKERLPAVLEMLGLLEKHYGVVPVVYTNKNSIDQIFGGKPGGLTKYPLWVASFKNNPPPTLPAGWADWKHWQYSDKGVVDGIQGNVDLDRCIGAPGPVVADVARIALSRAVFAAEETTADERRPPDPVVTLERSWRAIRVDAERLFPDGIARANVHLEIDCNGRTSVDIKLTGK